MGLLASKSLFKKQNDSFSNLKGQNGIIGIDNDPFKISGKNKFKPTGIEEDSFTKKQRNLAIINKYNKELVKKKALKSRKKYMKRQMEIVQVCIIIIFVIIFVLSLYSANNKKHIIF